MGSLEDRFNKNLIEDRFNKKDYRILPTPCLITIPTASSTITVGYQESCKVKMLSEKNLKES